MSRTTIFAHTVAPEGQLRLSLFKCSLAISIMQSHRNVQKYGEFTWLGLCSMCNICNVEVF